MMTAVARSVRELQMVEGLVDGAYELAQVFAAAAKGEPEAKPSLDCLDGFLKCSRAVRIGIRLCKTLRAPPKAMPAPSRAAAVEDEAVMAGRPEREGERREAERLEAERERDYEPVSLRRFLATLGVVARDARRLEDRLPGAAQVLPTLEGLLSEAKADLPTSEPTRESLSGRSPSPGAGVAVLAPPPRVATRHRLLGSAAPPRPGPCAPPRGSGSG
jgi:hypothetical protein